MVYKTIALPLSQDGISKQADETVILPFKLRRQDQPQVTLILAEKSGVDKKVYFCYSFISPAKEGKQNKRVFLTNNECKGYRVLAFSNKSRQDPALALAGEHFLFKPQGRTIFF